MKRLPRHLALALLLVTALLLARTPAHAQANDNDPVNIPASSPNGFSVNQMAYIANAIDHIDANGTPEMAGLAFFLVKAYQDNPNLNTGIAIRILLSARDKYDLTYLSTTVPNAYRFRMTPFDVTSNILALLALMPNNPVAFACNQESLNFVSHSGNHLSDSNDWLETATDDARLRASGGFDDYLTTRLMNLYLLAQTNPNVAVVADIFFGGTFNASVSDPAMSILNNNPPLRDSQNFAPLVSLIGTNGSIHTTLGQAKTIIESFYNRMADATTTTLNTLSQVTALQKDYAASFQNPNTLQQMQTLVNNNSALNAPRLQSAGAFASVAWETLAVDPKYTAYQQSAAVLRMSAKVSACVGDTLAAVQSGLDKKVVGAVGNGFKAVADGLDATAAALDVAAAFGAFGKSPASLTLDGINKIGKSLAAFQNQMNARLDVIDANINQLYTQMNSQFNYIANLLVTGFNLVNQGILNMQSQLLNISASLDRLTQTIDVFAQQSGRANLVTALQTIDLYVRNTPAGADNSQTFYTTTYVPLYINCQGFATFNALHNIGEVGTPLNNRQYDDYNLANELNSDPELNINYILQFANVHFNAKQFPGDTTFQTIQQLPTGIANPRSWEMSVLGMMRLASTFPHSFQQSTLNDTSKGGQGFFAAYNVGAGIQYVVAQTTLESDGTGLGWQQSPLFANLLLNQSQKAQALDSALQKLEQEEVAAKPSATLSDIVAYVQMQWNTTNPTADGQLLQNASRALNGSKHLLDSFANFGLGRSLESNDLLRSLLFSPQHLPDGAQIQTLYQQWLSSPSATNPRLTFEGQQAERYQTLRQLLLGLDTTDAFGHPQHTDGILDRIVADANNSGIPIGEPLPAVDAMLNRFAFFRRASVTGTVTPKQGAFIPGQPVTLTFVGAQQSFVVPVLLDANHKFTVWLPPDLYELGVKADRFLQKKLDTLIDTGLGSIPTVNNPTTINLQLLVGDIAQHNQDNATDLIWLRNAFGSRASDPAYGGAPSPNWNALADLNGDGVVDSADLALLRGNWGMKGDQVP
jgi:hypothetical protein